MKLPYRLAAITKHELNIQSSNKGPSDRDLLFESMSHRYTSRTTIAVRREKHKTRLSFRNKAKVSNLMVPKLMVIAIGAVNWGLVAFANGFNLVSKVASYIPFAGVDKIVYGLVAAAGVFVLYNTYK